MPRTVGGRWSRSGLSFFIATMVLLFVGMPPATAALRSASLPTSSSTTVYDTTANSPSPMAELATVSGSARSSKVGHLGGATCSSPTSPSALVAADGGIEINQSINTTISAQRQARHVLDSPLYNGGGYFKDASDAQRVLDAYHSGDASILRTTRNGNVIVRYRGVTGYNNNPGAGYLNQPTNVFMIKGTKSVSGDCKNLGVTPEP